MLNLFLGTCAVVAIISQQYTLAVYLILGAGIADFFDGMAARLLKVQSPIGKELDSLADMVSFGVVPGLILYALLAPNFASHSLGEGIIWEATPAFLVTAFSALRLAKFNLDTRQTENFIGLNTPATTIFVVGLLLIQQTNTFGGSTWISHPMLLYPLIVVLSYLLVAELPMFSFKFKSLKWQGNEARLSFLVIAISLLVTLKAAALSFIILSYLLFNIVLLVMGKNK